EPAHLERGLPRRAGRNRPPSSRGLLVVSRPQPLRETVQRNEVARNAARRAAAPFSLTTFVVESTESSVVVCSHSPGAGLSRGHPGLFWAGWASRSTRLVTPLEVFGRAACLLDLGLGITSASHSSGGLSLARARQVRPTAGRGVGAVLSLAPTGLT